MNRGFEHQEAITNFAFSRTASQPQQVGVRLKPKDDPKPEPAPPERPNARGAF